MHEITCFLVCHSSSSYILVAIVSVTECMCTDRMYVPVFILQVTADVYDQCDTDPVHTLVEWYRWSFLTRASSSHLNADQIPATFWITNPQNVFRDNAAAASRAYGFWYDLDNFPSGASFTTSVCPNKMPFGVFENNVAHLFRVQSENMGDVCTLCECHVMNYVLSIVFIVQCLVQ